MLFCHGRRQQKKEDMAVNGADNNLDNHLDPYHALHLNKSTDSGNKSGNSGCAAQSLATVSQ
jgi:hypothetical protein